MKNVDKRVENKVLKWLEMNFKNFKLRLRLFLSKVVLCIAGLN